MSGNGLLRSFGWGEFSDPPLVFRFEGARYQWLFSGLFLGPPLQTYEIVAADGECVHDRENADDYSQTYRYLPH